MCITTTSPIYDMIDRKRTEWIIKEITPSCGLLKGTPYFAIVGPHKPTGHISDLQSGRYMNFYHTEISVHLFSNGAEIRLHQHTVHNDHVSTSGCSYPYIPGGRVKDIKGDELPVVHQLIDELIKRERAKINCSVV